MIHLSRTKVVLLSLILIGLFSSGFYAEASYTRGSYGYWTTIDTVTHPESVKIGKSFEVEVFFNYSYSPSSCLYGDYIWLFYDVSPNPYVDFTQYITKTITELRPPSVSIKIDTLDLDCAINDTFMFRIRFNEGIETCPTCPPEDRKVYDEGNVTTENYELTIVEEIERWTNFAVVSPISIIAPILILSIALIVTKRKKGELN